eukprot:COSAG04_NODE_896_length_9591_cov_4.392752_2_plen_167_part_00
MRSSYNGATVLAVTYTGEATRLSWELQHSLCAAAGRATPGSDLSSSAVTSYCNSNDCTGWQDKLCAYSPSDNHVVADDCVWAYQEFTHVSGTLGDGVGYMCAGYDSCEYQVWVVGTAADGQYELNKHQTRATRPVSEPAEAQIQRKSHRPWPGRPPGDQRARAAQR